MSEKKAAKNTQPNFFQKAANGFVNFFKKIGNAFKNMWHELKKVTWPSQEKLLHYTAIVLLFMVFMIVVIGLIDLGATQLVKLIMKL
jgi:preprotein translocase subunit SecE